MNILLIAATDGEISPLRAHLSAYWQEVAVNKYHWDDVVVTLAITGVGAIATSYVLTKQLAQANYDLVLQVGIMGTCSRHIALGSVLLIDTDRFADMGAEDRDTFIDVFEMGLANANAAPYNKGWLPMPDNKWLNHLALPRVNSITVNTVSGNAQSIERLQKRYGFEGESMEGAAFHYVCLLEKVPFMQVRAVSNYIEPRDKSKWKIKEAVLAINEWAIRFLEQGE